MSEVTPSVPDLKNEPPKKQIKFDILPLALACCKLLSSWLTLWGLGYYRFSPSWIALGAVTYLTYTRMRQKRALISGALKAIGLDEKQSILNNIGAHELPSWVYFPDVERAEWLNKVIHRMWPFITDYVTDILLKTVEPAVNNCLPASLQPFTFLRTDLGDTPPRIGGVKVYTEESIRRDEIVMDVDVMFYSDARIKISVGKVIAGIKEFELRGTLRVLMKPLVPKIPFAGAVTVCFMDNPYINFSLTHAGNVLGLPGLQQTLNRTVQDAVSSICVLPNRVSVSLVDDVSMAHLKFPSAQGVLRINVVSASDLVASDINIVGKNASDPYCVVRVGAQKFVTVVKKSTTHPTWNGCFEAVIEQKFGPSLQLEVWDEDKGSKDDELGWASIPIDSIYQQGHIDTAVTLEGVKQGKVHLKLTWLDLSTLPADANASKHDCENSTSLKSYSTAYLFVRVEQAKNLARVKFVQEPSPYCILQLGNTVQNTSVKDKTQNPLWESIHHFLLSNPEIERLNIEIRDSKTEFLLGTCGIPLKHLMAENDMTVTRPYRLKATTNEGAVLYLHMELRMLVPGRDRRADSKPGTSERSDSPSNAPVDTASNGRMSPDSEDMQVRQRTADPRVITPPEPTVSDIPNATGEPVSEPSVSVPTPIQQHDDGAQDNAQDDNRSSQSPSRSPSPGQQGTNTTERESAPNNSSFSSCRRHLPLSLGCACTAWNARQPPTRLFPHRSLPLLCCQPSVSQPEHRLHVAPSIPSGCFAGIPPAPQPSMTSGGPLGVAPPNPAGKIRMTLYYNVDLEILEITVHRIEGLTGVNKHGTADAYVKLLLLHSNNSDLDDSKKTKVVYGELSPVFEESFDFAIRQQELEFCSLRIDVKQHAKFFSRKSAMPLLGSTSIDLQTLEVGRGCTEWYWLTGFFGITGQRSRTPSSASP